MHTAQAVASPPAFSNSHSLCYLRIRRYLATESIRAKKVAKEKKRKAELQAHKKVTSGVELQASAIGGNQYEKHPGQAPKGVIFGSPLVEGDNDEKFARIAKGVSDSLQPGNNKLGGYPGFTPAGGVVVEEEGGSSGSGASKGELRQFAVSSNEFGDLMRRRESGGEVIERRESAVLQRDQGESTVSDFKIYERGVKCIPMKGMSESRGCVGSFSSEGLGVGLRDE